MSPEYRLCPQSTVYDHRVRYISSDCSESPYIIVFLQRVQYILQSAVYVLRSQFMSLEYCLCPQSAVYVPRVQFMSPECSLCP